MRLHKERITLKWIIDDLEQSAIENCSNLKDIDGYFETCTGGSAEFYDITEAQLSYCINRAKLRFEESR